MKLRRNLKHRSAGTRDGDEMTSRPEKFLKISPGPFSDLKNAKIYIKVFGKLRATLTKARKKMQKKKTEPKR